MLLAACHKRCLQNSVLRDGVCVRNDGQGPSAGDAAGTNSVPGDLAATELGGTAGAAGAASSTRSNVSADAPTASIAGTSGATPGGARDAAGANGTEPPAAQSANDNAGTSGGAVCSGSQTSCDGNNFRQCGAQGWMTGMACPLVCRDGGCSGECVPRKTQCSENVAQRCNGPEWSKWKCEGKEYFACEGGRFVSKGVVVGECEVVCKPNAQGCRNTGGQTCWGAGCSMSSPNGLEAVRCSEDGGGVMQKGYCLEKCLVCSNGQSECGTCP